MGSACCVAARDRTIINGSNGDVMPRNVRYSPSWSFRWDNRGRVAEEEVYVNWLSDGVGTNDRLDNKSQTTVETAYASEVGSPLESFQDLSWQKSSPSEGNTVRQSGPLNSGNSPEVKESRETLVTLEPSPTKISRWPHRSPGHHLLRQVSDSHIPVLKSPKFSNSEDGSPFMLPGLHPGWSHESHTRSHGGSFDGFSSFDSESLSFNNRVFSPSIDTQTCIICSKFLTEKSSWAKQKIMASNELAVVAILICGHVFHAECLENMTPGINKYDPACPVCTYGEKKVIKLSEKALRAEMDLNAKIKILRARVLDGDSVLFDRSSSSMKSSMGKPFLRKHFSFGLKGSRSMSENKSSRKKGFLWGRSSKE